jgi:hypothetical protein
VKNINPADPIAAVVGAVIMILANTGVMERLNLTADQVANIGGAVITIAATIRTFMRQQRTSAPPS